MIENKRFTHQRTDDYNFSDILDDGKWIGICHVDCEDDFVNLLNELHEKNEQLKQKLEKYEEIEELKKEGFIGCYNCKNDRSVHDGVALDGMCCIKELMNVGGYFDTKYHKLPSGTICPCWELEE